MTNREQQLLSWIREDPLISQQQLADRAGITRSSVAVHVSNMMRKGLIRGRGYLLNSDPYIAVVGGVNVDIGGVSQGAFLAGDSNPGHVTITPGGVGRNIAENLCRMGRRVVMITALGQDANASIVRQSCDELGIDLSHSITVAGARTSTYLCLSDPSGELVGAVSDMAIYQQLTPEALASKLPVLNAASLVVLDANLTAQAIDYLAQNVTAPLIADPVSVSKAGRLRGALGKLITAKPNRPEASLLSGVDIRTDDDLPKAARRLHQAGMQTVFISLGARGVYYSDGQSDGILPCFDRPIINTTGCGDAFLAAAADAWLDGLSPQDMAKRGLAASAICAASHSAVCPQITREGVMQLAGQ